MLKLIKNNYLFLILFLIILIKEPIYKMMHIKDNIYNSLSCHLLEEDYNKLLEFNNIDVIYDVNYINTIIIYKDIYNYLNEITIKGGSNQDILKYPVIFDNTLIGVIDKVNKNTSIVKLLTNKDSKISVKINDEIGLLEEKDSELIVSNISNYSQIKVGDMIFTSGLGNIKDNIYIGLVKEIIDTNKDIEKIIKVDYRINIKDIDYVTILKETK